MSAALKLKMPRFAFINFRKDPEKALLLNGSYLGGLRLEVVMARHRVEYVGYPNFKGCELCRMAFHKRLFREFYETSGGQIYRPREPGLEWLTGEGDYEEPFSDEDGEEAILTNNN
ncbi:unnamed protein product [Arabidopsis arenosa]|uniref:Uncharacterized protein n=1 Tax=Arabidopsis arenosa TaxID=38785 RepID=A0A8S2BAV3_ARAAE|nr:unnamed protein product [Arabidopsis arenosa]